MCPQNDKIKAKIKLQQQKLDKNIVKNAAQRTLTLRELHWLKVPERI